MTTHERQTDQQTAETHKAPKIGQLVTVYGVRCSIFKIRPMGTIDVVALDGSRAWRLSGLAWTDSANQQHT
jgi:hypothetical protein